VKAGNQLLMSTDADPMKPSSTQFATKVLPAAPFSRTSSGTNSAAATAELCRPIAIAAFGFVGQGGNNGISAHLATSTCLEPEGEDKPFPGEDITGCAFRYRQPDIGFKYVTIHELGHTFGLCHVDGLLRIMFTGGQSVSSASSWWQYWTTGVEAGFTFDEGKRVWDYIVRNFGSECLQTRQF
jgi:hypothetical protein